MISLRQQHSAESEERLLPEISRGEAIGVESKVFATAEHLDTTVTKTDPPPSSILVSDNGSTNTSSNKNRQAKSTTVSQYNMLWVSFTRE